MSEGKVYRVTVLGNPGPAAVNARVTPVVRKKGKFSYATLILTATYKKWRAKAVQAMEASESTARFPSGPIHVDVAAYWPRKHDIGPAEGLPLGDVDAVVKACLDALGKGQADTPGANIIGDDAQAMSAPLTKRYDKKNPRIEITIYELPGDQ